MHSCLRAVCTSVVAAVVVLFGATSCGNDYWSSYDNIDVSKFEANYSLARLAQQVKDGDVYDVVDDYVVEGVVTANDDGNNFYQTYLIEAGGAAIEIQDGVSGSHVRHRLDYVMAVRLQGLRVIRYKGVMQVGLPAVTGGGVESFGVATISDRYVYNRGVTDTIIPPQMTAIELRAAEASISNYCGRLIQVVNLRYAPSLINDWNLSYVENIWSGYRPFVDASVAEGEENNSDAVWVNTSSYADFSGVTIETGVLSIVGILYYGSAGSYSGAPTAPILKMRAQADVSVYE
ncbi:MAG: DUF5689 domain-containing protein [Rikenellaceae bacterium]